MKRRIMGIPILLLAVLLMGCGQKLDGIRELRTEQVERIEVYTGGVPMDARRKTVTDPDELESVLSMLRGIRIRREAREDELLAGALGLGFRVVGRDGSEVALWWNDGQVSYEGVRYWGAGGPGDEAAFWKGLSAPEEQASEEELP